MSYSCNIAEQGNCTFPFEGYLDRPQSQSEVTLAEKRGGLIAKDLVKILGIFGIPGFDLAFRRICHGRRAWDGLGSG